MSLSIQKLSWVKEGREVGSFYPPRNFYQKLIFNSVKFDRLLPSLKDRKC